MRRLYYVKLPALRGCRFRWCAAKPNKKSRLRFPGFGALASLCVDVARAGRGVAKAGVPRTKSCRSFCHLGATQPNPNKLRELLQEQKGKGSAPIGVPNRIAQRER